MINARFCHQMTLFAAGKRLIVTGGNQQGTDVEMNDCEVYDMGEDSWSSIAPMNEKRAWHAALEVKNGVIYVFCGSGEHGKPINSIEYFSNDSWKTIPIENRIEPRSWPAVVANKSGADVIIFGGEGDYGYFKNAFYLETSSNKIIMINKDIR